MSRVFWDTNLFIYLIEDVGKRSEAVVRLRERMLARNDQLFTSSLTLGEVLVKPIEMNEPELAARYEQALTDGATIVPFDVDAARTFA
ncbi:MAG TPA: PIN domain-containing protein, partial [Thermoleophilia bacterium]|nr:PIN domain-containing protein [Thermoleophilia bacterium]